MSATGSIEWSESGSAAEIQGMIEGWKAEGKRGATLLIAVQEIISEEFLTTLSPRSCNNLSRFLTQYDVPVDARVGYPNYRAILDLIRRNPTLAGCGVWSLYQDYGSLRVRYQSSPLAVMAYEIQSSAPNHCSRVLPDA
jgi:hypothetical protein